MINPSEINLSTLPWLPLEEKSAFPRQPAIYFAIDAQDQIQYIGRSIDPKSRWVGHHRYEQLAAIGQVRIAYLFVDSPELLPAIESALIEWFDPPLNVYKGAFSKQSRIIADILRRKGMTQQDLATILGRALPTVQNWIRGVSIPELTPEETIQLCEAVGCSLKDLAIMFPGLSRRREAIKQSRRQEGFGSAPQESAPN